MANFINNPDNIFNPLVQNLLVEVENTASRLKDNPDAEIEAVLSIVAQITSVQQLGFYTGSKPLSEYYSKSPAVRYLPVGEETGLWTCGCFAIPPFGKIPLHDHPEMVGVIRVLEGSVDIESFDSCKENSPYTLYRGSAHFEAPSTVCLGATDSNIHQISAGEQGAVFLDILMPDYDDESGRCCNFYSIAPEVDNRSTLNEDGSLAQASLCVVEKKSEKEVHDCKMIKLQLRENNDVSIFTTQWPASFPTTFSPVENDSFLSNLVDLSAVSEPPSSPDFPPVSSLLQSVVPPSSPPPPFS